MAKQWRQRSNVFGPDLKKPSPSRASRTLVTGGRIKIAVEILNVRLDLSKAQSTIDQHLDAVRSCVIGQPSHREDLAREINVTDHN